MAGSFYDYVGIVEEVREKEEFASGFCKRDLIVTDDLDAQSKFPNHLPFSFKKDNCARLDGIRKGQRVKVRFAINGRAWQDPKTGTTRYFTDLTAFNVEVMNADGTSTEPLPSAPEVPADVPNIAADDPDDLPF